jgi:hypothetical protein
MQQSLYSPGLPPEILEIISKEVPKGSIRVKTVGMVISNRGNKYVNVAIVGYMEAHDGLEKEYAECQIEISKEDPIFDQDKVRITRLSEEEFLLYDKIHHLYAESIRKKENHWSPEWPTKTGTYWFCGKFKLGCCKDDEPEIMLVSACKTSSGTMSYVGNNMFIFKEEMEGVWMDAILPEKPK